jgi:hypothetical protein
VAVSRTGGYPVRDTNSERRVRGVCASPTSSHQLGRVERLTTLEPDVPSGGGILMLDVIHVWRRQHWGSVLIGGGEMAMDRDQ